VRELRGARKPLVRKKVLTTFSALALHQGNAREAGLLELAAGYLRSPEPGEREAALAVLLNATAQAGEVRDMQAIADAGAIKALPELLSSTEPDEVLRAADLAGRLARVEGLPAGQAAGLAAAVKPLLALLGHKVLDVEQLAFEALVEISRQRAAMQVLATASQAGTGGLGLGLRQLLALAADAEMETHRRRAVGAIYLAALAPQLLPGREQLLQVVAAGAVPALALLATVGKSGLLARAGAAAAQLLSAVVEAELPGVSGEVAGFWELMRRGGQDRERRGQGQGQGQGQGPAAAAGQQADDDEARQQQDADEGSRGDPNKARAAAIVALQRLGVQPIALPRTLESMAAAMIQVLCPAGLPDSMRRQAQARDPRQGTAGSQSGSFHHDGPVEDAQERVGASAMPRGQGAAGEGAQSEQQAAAAGGERCCAMCGAKPGPRITLSRCGRCRVAMYCSKRCQTTHWLVHREVCKALARAAAPAAPKQ
jgi:hypothetical protein